MQICHKLQQIYAKIRIGTTFIDISSEITFIINT